MKKQSFLFAILALTLLVSCSESGNYLVKSVDEFNSVKGKLQPGDVVVLANGRWENANLVFDVKGSPSAPITLTVEEKGKVFLVGESNLKIGGEFLIVDGLYFKDGFTPSNAVIDFKLNKEQVANNCKVINTVIEDYNQPSRDTKDHWVEFWGRNNVLANSYVAGKSNEGPTIRVEIKGNRNIKNYHKIINNHFGPRPRKGGPKGETIQLGDSFSSMSPSNTLVANNLFEECNGEVEVISSKTNFNEFRNNVFYKSEGSLVTRHGNYCIIDGNYFIGDGESKNYGGIRLINTGHSVTNNYFYNLKGENFRSPLAVMNGIPKSPLNRYNQVTDVVVAYNTWINSSAPLQFGVGTNISQAAVLPLSEIRSARPLRMVVANNLIFSDDPKQSVIVEHDKVDGVTFKNNYVNNYDSSLKQYEGLIKNQFSLDTIGDNILIPTEFENNIELYQGFEFDKISKDILGNSRGSNNTVGAMIAGGTTIGKLLNKKLYGADWYSNEVVEVKSETHSLNTTTGNLSKIISKASNGDSVILENGKYIIDTSIKIDRNISIVGKGNVEIHYVGSADSPLFEMFPKGELNLKNVNLVGNGKNYAFASLQKNMSSHYNLSVSDCRITSFNYVLKAYKQSFAQEIFFVKTKISNCENGIVLSEETNDKGDYNVEFLTIDSCQFDNVKQNVIDYYRGGYDESTIGGNLKVSNTLFTNSGSKEENNILINTRGIINVDISNNSFENNKVTLVALLWGAKNNTHSNNSIKSSGEILVEENLKLKLVY